MPRPDLLAVRSALGITSKQSHRIVAFAALGDVTRRRPRWQWTHPGVADQLGVPDTFVELLQGYLELRALSRQLSTERGIRLHTPHGAQLYRIPDGMPLDLVNLGPSQEHEALLGGLLREAISRKVRVDGETVLEVERLMGRSCGQTWEDLTAAFQRQRTAQEKEVA
ncbi:hypothetical protein [Streptomyces sp. NPDC059761]|uniref:hypothetical protein n=1 Tax=Streptomyces sp. NPDC059761 TaxID=3346937 RepID=UPI003663998B